MTVLAGKLKQSDRQSRAMMRHRMWDSLCIDDQLGEIIEMRNGRDKRTGYVATLDGDHVAGLARVSIREHANGGAVQPVPFLEGIWVEPEYRERA